MCVHFPCTYSSPITMQQLRVALEQEIQTQSLPLERMDPDQKVQCWPEIKALSYSTPRSPSEKRIRKLATTLQEIKGVSAFVLRARNTTLSLLVYFPPISMPSPSLSIHHHYVSRINKSKAFSLSFRITLQSCRRLH